MKTLKFKKIDAFTGGLSTGNPAGYILMQEGDLLDEAEMQKIAAELKGFVNEVGFVRQLDDRYTLRFFSSECEVAFCGHATIAILYDLLSSRPQGDAPAEVLIQVNAGILPVYNFIKEQDAVYITAPAPQFLKCRLNHDQVADALSIQPTAIDRCSPIRIIDGGLRTLIVPLTTLEHCLSMRPDQEKLRLFCLANEIDIVHVWVKETFSASSQYRTRVFAPKYGYLEDPATGSGNAAFGYYLLDENRWQGDLTLEQGPSKANPNFVKLKRCEKDGAALILFGGNATTRIDGYYYLHPVLA